MEDDDALLRRLRAGDEMAFELLLEQHDASLRRVARTFVKTASAVEEVVQETWLGVVKGIGGFEGRSSLKTWIFNILANRARTRAVRDARSLPFSALEVDGGAAVDPDLFGEDGRWRSAPARVDLDPQQRVLGAELRVRLFGAIDGLSDQQRAVVTLRDIVGMSAQEVCETLEISEGNQRVLLHRGRSQLRSTLAGEVT
ncbi:MAG TPA: RNA polymerase sigma factor [Solirubrobacteraceae bacterium]|nr:RNA polymerase sigma factor [Solirubrobacteraceae bacterium]